MAALAGQALLGLSSYAFRWAFGSGDFRPARRMTAQGLIDIVAAAGLGVVQLCDNVPWLSYSPAELGALRDHTERAGIRLETGIRGTAPGQLDRALTLSERLGATLLRVVVEIDRRDDIARQLDGAAQDLQRIMPLARERAVCLAIENHATMAAAEMALLLKRVADDHCGCCIDTMNSVLLLEHPETTVSELAPYAISIHLKDFRLSKNADCFRVDGTALGEGLLDLPQVVRIIRSRASVRSWHVELYLARSGSEDETLKQERRAVDRSIAKILELRSEIASEGVVH